MEYLKLAPATIHRYLLHNLHTGLVHNSTKITRFGDRSEVQISRMVHFVGIDILHHSSSPYQGEGGQGDRVCSPYKTVGTTRGVRLINNLFPLIRGRGLGG